MKAAVVLSFLLMVAGLSRAKAQEGWPRMINAADGSIFRIYQPQPDSFRGQLLAFHAAFSWTAKGGRQPVFGSFRALAVVETDRDNRLVSMVVANVLSVNFSVRIDPDRMDELKETLECGLPGAGIDIPLDELLGTLPQQPDSSLVSKDISHMPPRIIVTGKPSILVLIDGIPKLQWYPEWYLRVVANSANTLVESDDGWFYLYGGRHWYIAPTVAGPYDHTGFFPPDLWRVQSSVDQANARGSEHSDTTREGRDVIQDIILSMTPAELIQTKGAPVFNRIGHTSLLYVTNTNNDIFLDSIPNLYYVLISGRWYRSSRLASDGWTYVPSDSLPRDFARIPEGSPKDNVLASVAGTAAAREAVLDACIPQTARIDRAKAFLQVSYDGKPVFADIRGTHLQYAQNTSSVVLRQRNQYYALDKGVWFQADAPGGPWKLSTERPEEVSRIPPDCPVYFCRYVFIYEVTPDYIYTGYTGGYLGNFIDGGTVVYGTGYYYPSWSGHIGCRRPWTWGFGARYNPWFGWCLGNDLGLNWLNTGAAWGTGYWPDGWWGPSGYRPAYVWHRYSGHGLYEADIRRVENVNYTNNIYRNRPDSWRRLAAEQVFTDTDGQVWMHDGLLGWLQRAGDRWDIIGKDPTPLTLVVERIEQGQQRGRMRLQNFLQMQGTARAPR